MADRCPNRLEASKGARNANRSGISIRPSSGWTPRPPSCPRNAAGVAAYTEATVALKDRIDPNPAAYATSASGRSVVCSRTRPVCARRSRASRSGMAPTSASVSRCTCRTESPSRDASPATPSRSTTPSPMSRMARAVTSALASHSGEPGTASGRQRLHARNPSACAAAALAKKSMFSARGVLAGQDGRQ